MKNWIKRSLCILLFLTSLTGCNNTTQTTLQKYSRTTLTAGFDTVITLVGYTKDEETFNKHFSQLVNEFVHYNELFDKYNTYTNVNNIKTINDNAGIQATVVEEDLFEMLSMAKEFYGTTNGAFDSSLGSTMEIWHDYREAGIKQNGEGITTNLPVPSKKELLDTYYDNGWEYIELNETKQTVYISNADVSLDVGGIAKGFATEKVAQHLETAGLTAGAINGGGNVRTIGAKPDGSKWSIGVTEPDDTSKNVGIIYLEPTQNFSVVTSGDYQRYYISDSIRYSHILNPYTLFPADGYRSVTIVTSNSAVADVLSTALFVMSYEDGLDYVNTYNQDNPNDFLGVYWIFDSNNIDEATKTIGMTLDGYWVVPTNNLRSMIAEFGATK